MLRRRTQSLFVQPARYGEQTAHMHNVYKKNIKMKNIKLPFDFPPENGINSRIIILAVLRSFRRELENGNIKLRVPSGSSGERNFRDELILQFQNSSVYTFGNGENLTLHAGEVLMIPRQTGFSALHHSNSGFCTISIRDDSSTVNCCCGQNGSYEILGEQRLRRSGFYSAVIPALYFASDGLVRRMLLLSIMYQTENDIMNIKRNFSESGVFPHRLAFRARRIIEDWPSGSFPDISEVAKLAGCSVNYLSTVFHSSYGVTLKSFLLHHKLENARRTLYLGKMRPAEAAEFCGFRDAGYFARIFKKTFGCTPSSLYRGGAENNFVPPHLD